MSKDVPPFKLFSQPGIMRDGTQFETVFHTDGLWVRWNNRFARKMGGYRVSSEEMHGPSRGLILQADGLITQLHNGWSNGIERIQIGEDGLALGPPVDRTPVGFVTDPQNLWVMDIMYNAGATNSAILAVAMPSANSLASNVAGTIYIGDVNGVAALTALAPADGPADTAGGLFVVPPYLIVYGLAGYVTWSAPNTPSVFTTGSGGGGATGARVAKTKIVAGMALRGGPGNSPAFLLWSLDSLIRGSFNGGSTVFGFDTVSTDITVLSQKGIVEYDGAFYWPGLDRFYMFNGVVQEWPNPFNKNFFFDNLNYDYHEKVFTFKIPRWSEIWICFPLGTSTECNHALVYNTSLKTWYDTPLPNGGRSAAAYAQILRYPMMGGIAGSSNIQRLWQHEFGYDEIVNSTTVNAIDSFYTTADFSPMSGIQGFPQGEINLDVQQVDADYILRGSATMQMLMRKYPLAPTSQGPVITLNPAEFDPAAPQTYTFPVRKQARITRFQYRSNVVGGFYQAGDFLAHTKIGDKRP